MPSCGRCRVGKITYAPRAGTGTCARLGDSSELKSRILLIRQAILKRIELIYEAELSTLNQTERQQTLIAIESLIDFESWSRMRNFSGLSIEEAREVWVKSIDLLLPPTPVS